MACDPVSKIVLGFSYICGVTVRGYARDVVNKVGLMGKGSLVFKVGIEIAELVFGR